MHGYPTKIYRKLLCLCVLQVLSAGVGFMLYNRKICLKWESREPRRSTIIILQEVGLKTGSDILLSSDLCQWMRAKKFEQVSYHIKAFGILYYVQPETCFNDLYQLLELHKRFSLKKKLAVESDCKLHLWYTHQTQGNNELQMHRL